MEVGILILNVTKTYIRIDLCFCISVFIFCSYNDKIISCIILSLLIWIVIKYHINSKRFQKYSENKSILMRRKISKVFQK